MALIQGLKLVKDKGFKNIIIDMDSKLIVDKMKTQVSRNQAYYFALKECQALLNGSSLNGHLVHCYWESNRVADAHANIGVTQVENLLLYDFPPPDTYVIFREDLVGWLGHVLLQINKSFWSEVTTSSWLPKKKD